MGYIPALKNYQNSKNYNIYFTHVPTNNQVSFPAIIKSFQEAEEKLKTYNKEIRKDLIDKFSYKNSLVKIKEVIKNTN